MGVLVYILGRSGTGKSYSMRNFQKGEIGVVNVQGKILPFKGSGALDIENTDDSGDIVKCIERMSKKYKTVVVDDFQYVMANEFMRRATERGYDKFTEIARHAWDIANKVRELPQDVIVYVLCHTDTDQDGFEKLKTIGKLLDEKIVLEGMSTIVLKTAVSDGQYMFLTQNNGHDTVKSPAGMFPSYAIDNDLKYVDDKIRNYYELGEFLTDEQLKPIDDAVKHDDVQLKEEKKSRRAKRGEEKKEEPAKAPVEEEKEEATADTTAEPKRRRRRSVSEELAEERAEVDKENAAIIAQNDTDGDEDEKAFEEATTPDIKELPKRKRRTKVDEPEEAQEEEKPQEEAATPRRRRRRG
jgi:hypothetical protein